MDISCSGRNGGYCAAKNCPFDETSHGCQLDVIIEKLNGYHCGHRYPELVDILTVDIPDEVRTRTGEEIDCVLPSRYNRPNFLFAVKLADTRKALEAFQYPNFIYYRPAKLTFIDVHGGSHDRVMTLFYWLARLVAGKANSRTAGLFDNIGREMFQLSTAAESFITEGYGFFSSSVYKGMGIPRLKGFPIIYSSNHKLTFQEKKIFDGYGYDPLEDKEEN